MEVEGTFFTDNLKIYLKIGIQLWPSLKSAINNEIIHPGEESFIPKRNYAVMSTEVLL